MMEGAGFPFDREEVPALWLLGLPPLEFTNEDISAYLFSEKEAVSLCIGAARTCVQDAEDKDFGCSKVTDWQRAATTRHDREKSAGLSDLDARTERKARKVMQ
jgi:hypothetical protein